MAALSAPDSPNWLQMPNLALFVGLRGDQTNTVASLIEFENKQNPTAPLLRDGAVLLADNLVLLDRTKAHGALVRLCAVHEKRSWPYLLLHIECPASLASGTLSAEVAALLATAGVPLIAQS